MTSTWFAPAPSELTSTRVSLDFGLRSADQFYRELVVPELGRVWFVRQLSWPLAALVLHGEMKSDGDAPKPTAICHGIEALACKLEFFDHYDDLSDRILGRRAFDREEEAAIWSFQKLRQRDHYVRNTHRMAATRAVRSGTGLGFAAGPRFDLLELAPVGRALANAFLDQRVGQGSTTLRKWLIKWIRGDGEVPRSSRSFTQALSPAVTTGAEREHVQARVLDLSTVACVKRRYLADAVGRAAKFPDIEDVIVDRLRKAGHDQQAKQVVAARAFGALLDRSRDVVAELTRAIEPARGGMTISTLVVDKRLRASLASVRTAAKSFTVKASATEGASEVTSAGFAAAIAKGDDVACIRLVVARASEVLALAGGSIVRGGLFRVVPTADSLDGLEEGSSSIEPDRTGRTFRIANLHSLLRDLKPREDA